MADEQKAKRLDPLRNDPRFQKLVERFDPGIPE